MLLALGFGTQTAIAQPLISTVQVSEDGCTSNKTYKRVRVSLQGFDNTMRVQVRVDSTVYQERAKNIVQFRIENDLNQAYVQPDVYLLSATNDTLDHWQISWVNNCGSFAVDQIDLKTHVIDSRLYVTMFTSNEVNQDYYNVHYGSQVKQVEAKNNPSNIYTIQFELEPDARQVLVAGFDMDGMPAGFARQQLITPKNEEALGRLLYTTTPFGCSAAKGGPEVRIYERGYRKLYCLRY